MVEIQQEGSQVSARNLLAGRPVAVAAPIRLQTEDAGHHQMGRPHTEVATVALSRRIQPAGHQSVELGAEIFWRVDSAKVTNSEGCMTP